jgi:ABC-type nitrate/sulfonate/bicarbonate transport system substrate-binding protein
LRGGDTVRIAGVVNKGLQRILTIPEIKTPADLKGKRVGVTRIGAVSQVVLLMMLQRWKMSPNDVQVMQVGSSPNMLVSLDKKGIEAAVLTIPSMFVAEDRGYRVLIDMADTDIFYLHDDRHDSELHQEQPRQSSALSQRFPRRAGVRQTTQARVWKSSRKTPASASRRKISNAPSIY